MKSSKIKMLERLKRILDKKSEEDKLIFNAPLSRSMDTWFMILNSQLATMFRVQNKKELAGYFKLFNFIKTTSQRDYDGCSRKIIFYKYLSGYKIKIKKEEDIYESDE